MIFFRNPTYNIKFTFTAKRFSQCRTVLAPSRAVVDLER